MNRTGGHASLGSYRALLLVVAFGLCEQTGWAARFALQQPIPEVQLKDGTVLHGVTFVSVGEASITGKWAGGRGSIPLALLPDDVRGDLAPAKAGKAAAAPPSGTPGVAESTVEPGKLPTDIKLTNGFVMHQAKVVSWRADAMTVDYVGGKVLVKFDDVVPEQRMVFVAQKIEVFARHTRNEAARAANNSAPGVGGPPAPAAASGGPSASDMKALIQAGIAAHQLVIGMTRPEVVQAMGMPDGTKSDPSAPDYAYWLYRGRGRDAQGAACDRIVGFDKGILDGWRDQ